jgi:serine/threonine protein kinase
VLWENVSAALTDLHRLGFAHGDIKPANLGFDAGGAFFLIDLDSAARFGAATQRPSSTYLFTSGACASLQARARTGGRSR